MLRRTRSEMRDRRYTAPHDAPTETATPLLARRVDTSEAYLRALHRELRMWVPAMSVSLLTPAEGEPSLRLTYGQFGPCDLAWAEDDRAFVWTSGPDTGTSPGGSEDLIATVRSIARLMGATVRTM